jgi:two-component system, NarL family, sensor histidine kinase LiaS
LDSASERIALARALHDGLAQDLVALRFRVEFLSGSPSIDGKDAHELKKISLEISQITEKVRRELFNLREPISTRDRSSDFGPALESVIAPFRSDIKIDYKPSYTSMPDHLFELFLYITPELIRNTLKHAGASRIEIVITQLENSLQFTFSDNGQGGAQESELRYGLTGIRELVELNQGNFSIVDKGGTEICLNFPSQGSSL